MHRLWSWLDERPLRWVGVGIAALALVAAGVGYRDVGGAGAVVAAVWLYWAADRKA